VEFEQKLRSLSYFDVVGRLRLTVAMSKGFLKIPFLITDIVLDVDPVIGRQREEEERRKMDEEGQGPAFPACSSDSNSSSSSSSFAFGFEEASTPATPPDEEFNPFEGKGSFEGKSGEMLPKYDTVFCRLCIRMITVLEKCEGTLGVVEPTV
jgi:hypothetical protein